MRVLSGDRELFVGTFEETMDFLSSLGEVPGPDLVVTDNADITSWRKTVLGEDSGF